ncbi:MAG: hypothetical protein WCK89_11815, partial [bacterium]
MRLPRFASVAVAAMLFMAGQVLGSTYTFQRGSGVDNDWNSAANWTGGSSSFPDAAGDVAYSWANNPDTHIALNQDITVGNVSWYGYQLFIEPGSPAGKLIVNDGGTPTVWTNTLHYGFQVNCNMQLDSDLTIRHENDVNSGWYGELNGQISGAGKLSVAWYGGSG